MTKVPILLRISDVHKGIQTGKTKGPSPLTCCGVTDFKGQLLFRSRQVPNTSWEQHCNERNEIREACSTYGAEGFGGGNLRERGHSEDTGVDARTILQCIFKKCDRAVYRIPTPPPQRSYPNFGAVVGLVWSNDPESYAGDSVATGRVSHVRQVKGDDPEKKGIP